MPGRKGMNAIHAAGVREGVREMAEQATGRRKSAEGGGMLAGLAERLSFGATLVAVSAVAIFIGWLFGQYAIRTVTDQPASVGSVPAGTASTSSLGVSGVGAPPSSSGIRRRHVHSVVEFRRFITGLGPERRCSVVRLVGRRRFPARSVSTASTPAVSTPATPTGTSSAASPAASAPSASTSASTSTSTSASPSPRPATTSGSSTTLSAGGASSTGTASSGLWRVQAGAFSERARAEAVVEQLRAHGFEAFVTPTTPFRVQVGAFSDPARARALVEELRSLGFEAIPVAPN